MTILLSKNGIRLAFYFKLNANTAVNLTFSHPILLYDGPCPLCNRVVKFLLAADKNKVLMYAAQQTKEAEYIIDLYQIQDTSTLTEVVWLATPEGLYLADEAALRTLVLLKGPWGVVGKVGLWFPKFLRRWVYNWVSRNRYAMFKPFNCELPAQQRFRIPKSLK
jgi:predicted DCC family thiol-disulfide oxidoreductase YuxK